MQRKSAKGQRKKQKARIKKNPDNIETADEKSSVVCFYLFRKDSTGRTGGVHQLLSSQKESRHKILTPLLFSRSNQVE
jgi:hypothetical protein